MKEEAPRVRDYVKHIVEAIDRIFEYTEDLDEAGFLANRLVQDAVIRNIGMIGEAAQNIERTAPDFVERHH